MQRYVPFGFARITLFPVDSLEIILGERLHIYWNGILMLESKWTRNFPEFLPLFDDDADC